MREVLEEDEELDHELRQYIHRLLQSIEAAFDDDAIGLGFDAASATRQLWVALRAAESASTEHAPVWRELWLQMTAGTIAGAVVEAGKVTIAAITGTS